MIHDATKLWNEKNNNVAKTLSSNFSSCRQDRKKMNTDSESALKTTLKMCLRNFLRSAKMPLEHFWGCFSMQFLILNTFLQVNISLKCF